MEQKYFAGQRVKIITLIDGYGRPDPRMTEWVGKSGEVINFFYVSAVENWEKTLNPPDIFCYDVRLDDGGDIVRGIPEVGLEPEKTGSR
jgi:hypothetical protein